MSDQNSPIGVFDSGLGGLTVVRALRHLVPDESIIYFGDTARVPYGSKSAATVTRFSQQIVDFLLTKNVKLIVVACNTVSSLALPILRTRNTIPMTGVIDPGAEAATKATRSNHIGVIGTTATINSNAYVDALKAIDPNLAVVSIACPLFVPLVEEGWTDGPVAKMVSDDYLKPFWADTVDTVILGCTHYLILRDTIRTSLPENVRLVDSAEAVSEEVKRELYTQGIAARGGDGRLTCFVTDLPQKFEELGERFLGTPLPDVTLVRLD
ncbi:MAG: glutamate racemase [Fidelibacterota bacterium]